MDKKIVQVLLVMGFVLGSFTACSNTGTEQEIFHAISYSIPNEWEKVIENEDGNYYTANEDEEAYFGIDYSGDVLESKFDEDAKKDHFKEAKNNLINEEKNGVISNLQTENVDNKLPYYLIQYEHIYDKKEGILYVWEVLMFVEEDLYTISYSSKDNKDRVEFLKVINSVEMQ